MLKSDSIGALLGALSKAQAAFPPIPKNKTAQIKSDKATYSYRYADLADIIEAVKPALTANGLSISQHPEQVERGIVITTLLGHESGEWLESAFTVPGATATAQNVGSIITYARRYALASVLGVAPDEDVDGQTIPEPSSTKKAGAGRDFEPVTPTNPNEEERRVELYRLIADSQGRVGPGRKAYIEGYLSKRDLNALEMML